MNKLFYLIAAIIFSFLAPLTSGSGNHEEGLEPDDIVNADTIFGLGAFPEQVILPYTEDNILPDFPIDYDFDFCDVNADFIPNSAEGTELTNHAQPDAVADLHKSPGNAVRSTFPHRHTLTQKAKSDNEKHQLAAPHFSDMVQKQRWKLARLRSLSHLTGVKEEIQARQEELEKNEAREIFRFQASLSGSTLQRRALNARYEAHANAKLIKNLRSGCAERISEATEIMLRQISRRHCYVGSSSTQPILIHDDTSNCDNRRSITHGRHPEFHDSQPSTADLQSKFKSDDPIIDRIFQLIDYPESDPIYAEQRWKRLVASRGTPEVVSALFSDHFESQEEALSILSPFGS